MHKIHTFRGCGLLRAHFSSLKCLPPRAHHFASATKQRAYLGVTAAPSSTMRRSLHWNLPDELWGAVNAVSAGMSKSERKTFATSSAVCKAAASTQSASDMDMPSHLPQHIQDRLNQRPQLQGKQLALTLVLPFLTCVALTLSVGPASFSLKWSLAMGMLYIGQAALLRTLFMEQEFKALQVTEAELADGDSKFRELDGLTVHYKAAAPPGGAAKAAGGAPCGLAMYHGFGANTFSWSFVDRRLAEELGATVVSHDMPGFGLTQRSSEVGHYTIQSNGRIGRLLLDAELSAESSPKSDIDKASVISIDVQAGDSDRARQQGARPKRILVGHSLGGACAVAEVIDHPEGIDGLILVAPAVVAPLFSSSRGPSNSGLCRKEANSMSATFEGPEKVQASKKRQLPAWLRGAAGALQVLTAETAAAFARCVLWLLQPVLVLALRSAVRSRAFWERGLGSAWFQKTGVTPSILDAYRLPQLVQGWEWGLLRFLRARVTSGQSVWKALRSGYGQAERSQALRLKAAVAEHGIKVLIIHGEKDALVPRWNSQKLAALLDADLEVFQDCGHMPMEEMPDRFIATVAKFLPKCI
ncbi:hypothetical protein CVIRNUC_003164 [Coccomyxa viridis]|uniref:AB hydrolase-1 domain-containing protein n=1 Tax=Coccomyxa viridis TaxID=1274662 RepID=A0AAV1I253_9CHLO|nr:hypothetical protein CVIRNUC_003164 [Coccomyxa viridis]